MDNVQKHNTYKNNADFKKPLPLYDTTSQTIKKFLIQF
jgi:hypothetical protein